jgi:hypothetical protein
MEGSQLDMKVRTAESQTSDVFININDLIIELMLQAEGASSQEKKDALKSIIRKLTSIRNSSHQKD